MISSFTLQGSSIIQLTQQKDTLHHHFDDIISSAPVFHHHNHHSTTEVVKDVYGMDLDVITILSFMQIVHLKSIKTKQHEHLRNIAVICHHFFISKSQFTSTWKKNETLFALTAETKLWGKPSHVTIDKHQKFWNFSTWDSWNIKNHFVSLCVKLCDVILWKVGHHHRYKLRMLKLRKLEFRTLLIVNVALIKS